MDKGITKLMILPTGVDQADFYITDRFTFASNPEGIIEEIEEHFGKQYPLFVKPANAGSSVGISKAHDTKELFNAIRIAAVEDNKILIEDTIVGREIEVAVLGNLHPKASKVGEILAANEFYDYEAKYNNAASVTRIIDDLPEEKLNEVREDALTVYKTMGCKGLSRVDFFLTEDGRVVFNELNTLPGFTNISMYPKLWEATDLPYDELLDTLIDLAMDKME
jgi:D-alanine-D-alanine ligase